MENKHYIIEQVVDDQKKSGGTLKNSGNKIKRKNGNST
jgi:hypothetical protein